jgi:hypothetical protein
MSEKPRASGEIDVDFERLARVGSKINELLVRKTKGAVEAYAVLRFLSVYYQESLGITFEPEFEAELRRFVDKSMKGNCESAESAKKP